MATMSFTTLAEKQVTVTIGGGGGTLIPSSKPVIIEMEDSEDFFQPSRLTTGKISFIGMGNALANLIPASPTSNYVEICVDESTVFFGYLKCEAYSQSMDAANHVVTIPCHDILSTLGGIYIPFAQNSNHGFVKIGDFLATAFDTVDPEYSIEYCGDDISDYEICLDNFMRKNDNESGDAYDTDSYLSVIEEICKYFGYSVRCKGHTVYFCCQDITCVGTASYTLLRGTNQQVNYIRPISKIKISAEVNKNSESLWELSFDKMYCTSYKNFEYNSSTHKRCTEMLLSGGDFRQNSHYALKNEVDGTTFNGASAESVAIDDTNFSSKIICSGGRNGASASGWLFNAKSDEYNVLRGGKNLGIMIEGKGSFCNSISDKFDYTPSSKAVFEATLRIGDYFFNGTEWTDEESTFHIYLSETSKKFYIWENISWETFMKFGQHQACIINVPFDLIGYLTFDMRLNLSYAKFTAIDNFKISLVKGRPITGKYTDNDTNVYTASLNNGAKDEYSVDQKLTTAIGIECGKGIVLGNDDIQEMSQLTRYKNVLGKSRQGKVITCNYIDVEPSASCDGMAVIGYTHDLFNDKTKLTLQEY